MSRSGADLYFNRCKEVLEADPARAYQQVVYKIFSRLENGIVALEPARKLIENSGLKSLKLINLQPEGSLIRKDDKGNPIPFAELHGSLYEAINIETELLQIIGSVCASAYNARRIVEAAAPWTVVDMHARHNSSPVSAVVTAYAAYRGGFRSTSIENPWGLNVVGTMPHSFIGAYPSTLEAAKAFHASKPDVPLVVLVDYFGHESSDAMECFEYFGDKLFGVRVDTPGERYAEGCLRSKDDGGGKGVSIESIFNIRHALDSVGGHGVKIIASSGFNVEKIERFKKAFAPIDIIGTGSWPANPFTNTATADIVSYGEELKIKRGREWLLS